MNARTQLIVDLLTEWGQGDYRHLPIHVAGVCINLRQVLRKEGFEIGMKELRPLWTSWPHYSGNEDFPIPFPNNKMTPGEAYRKLRNLWNESKYGDLRRDLCRYLAGKLIEKELSEVK